MFFTIFFKIFLYILDDDLEDEFSPLNKSRSHSSLRDTEFIYKNGNSCEFLHFFNFFFWVYRNSESV